jgi:hypothetical protein
MSNGNETCQQVMSTHKRRKLEDVVEPGVFTADAHQTGKADLGNDGAELAGSSRDTMAGRGISGGEDLAGDDKGGRVGAEVLEEFGQAVEEDKRLLARVGGKHGVVAEAHAAQDYGEEDEAHELDRLEADPRQAREKQP